MASAAAVIVLVAVAAGCTSAPNASHPRHQPRDSRSFVPISPARVGACPAHGTFARVIRSAAQSSQDELVVSIKNTGRTACKVIGYPRIRVLRPASLSDRRAELRVKHGDTYFASDLGPRPITLSPHGIATFSVATTTGFGHAEAVTDLRITLLQWRNRGGLTVPCHLPISGPPGRAAPLWETALTA